MSGAVDPVQSALARLKEKYRADLPQKIAKIAEQVAVFLGNPWEQERCFTTYRMTHSLAGSAGTYGFLEIGTVARGAEDLLKESVESKAPLNETRAAELNAALRHLKELAAAC